MGVKPLEDPHIGISDAVPCMIDMVRQGCRYGNGFCETGSEYMPAPYESDRAASGGPRQRLLPSKMESGEL